MPKDLANMTHAERLAVLTRELSSPSCVAKADEILRLIKDEFYDVLAVRDRAAKRHPDAALPLPTSLSNIDPASTPARATDARQGPTSIKTIADLLAQYRTHKGSPYHGLRFRTRENYDSLLRRIEQDCADIKLANINARD